MSIEMWLARSDDPGRERELQERVWDELAGLEGMETSGICVRVTGRTVTLTGTVPDWPAAIEVERAAKRVRGVRMVANELEVSPSPENRLTDQELGDAVRHAIRWDVTVPSERIWTNVANGCVTLHGVVSCEHERAAAERAVSYLRGVRGVANRITVAVASLPRNFEKRVRAALARDPGLRGDRIAATVHGGTVVLEGRVRCLAERDEAEHDVRAVPGVTGVEDGVAVQ